MKIVGKCKNCDKNGYVNSRTKLCKKCNSKNTVVEKENKEKNVRRTHK